MHDLVDRPYVPLSDTSAPPLHVGGDSTTHLAVELDAIPLAEHGRIFTASMAAKALGMSKHQLYHLRRDGEIRSFKVGVAVYLTEADLVDFVNRRLADSNPGVIRPEPKSAN